MVTWPWTNIHPYFQSLHSLSMAIVNDGHDRGSLYHDGFVYQAHQRIRGFTTMRYINLRFTYLLTYQTVASFYRLGEGCCFDYYYPFKLLHLRFYSTSQVINQTLFLLTKNILNWQTEKILNCYVKKTTLCHSSFNLTGSFTPVRCIQFYYFTSL